MAKFSDTILCGCKSNWVHPFDRVLGDISIQLDHQFINNGSEFDSTCPKCNFWYQFNPLYENMLYDLRSMNTIW